MNGLTNWAMSVREGLCFIVGALFRHSTTQHNTKGIKDEV